jgi:hypothetical protein
MAAHLLHKSDSGELVSVVVLFRLGAENAMLARLLAPHARKRGRRSAGPRRKHRYERTASAQERLLTLNGRTVLVSDHHRRPAQQPANRSGSDKRIIWEIPSPNLETGDILVVDDSGRPRMNRFSRRAFAGAAGARHVAG